MKIMINFVLKLNIVYAKTFMLPGKMHIKCIKNLFKNKQVFY